MGLSREEQGEVAGARVVKARVLEEGRWREWGSVATSWQGLRVESRRCRGGTVEELSNNTESAGFPRFAFVGCLIHLF